MVLGRGQASVARVEGFAPGGEARNRGGVASSCVPAVLAAQIESQANREKPISKELQQVIFQMASENPTWGAPRIHGELKMLGFDVAERTISRWMKRQPRKTDPAQRWLSFLRNHREAIVAMDFFTMPTVTFHLLYCFFIIAHDRRRVLHFNVTDHPTSTWITQQIRETFPDEAGARFPRQFERWESCRSTRRCAARGRMAWPSVG